MRQRPLVKAVLTGVVMALFGLSVVAWRSTPVQMFLLSRATLPELEAKVTSNPNDWRTQFWFGKRAAEAGDFVRAEPALRAAAGTATDYLPATTEVAKLLLAQGRVEEAFQLLRSVVGRDAQQHDAQLALAQLYRTEGAYHKAIEILQKLKERRPRDVVVHYELAAAYSGLSQFPTAEEHLRAASALEPDNVMVLTALSIVRREQGAPADAEPFARRAVEKQPDDPRALMELARVLGAMEKDDARHAEALSLLQKAANLEMNNPAIPLEMGRLLSHAERWAEARPHLERAAALTGNTDSLFLLSRCLRELGQTEQSRQVEARFQQKEKHRKEVQRLLTRLESNPEDARVRFELARLFEADGQTGRAINYYRSGLQRDADNAEARKRLSALIRQSMERSSDASPPR